MRKRTYPRPCTECGRIFDEDGFYVKYKDTGSRFSRCKECHNERTRRSLKQERDANPEAFNAKRRARRAAKLEQYRESARRHYAEHREKELERLRVWRDKNRERLRAAERATWPTRRAHKLAYKAKRRDHYRMLNAQRRLRNAERITEWNREYYRAHRAEYMVRNHVRRARRRGNGGSFTLGQWLALKESYGYRCLRCGRCEPDVLLTPDHVVPVSRGGSSDISNIQPLCRSCNSAKNCRTIDYR